MKDKRTYIHLKEHGEDMTLENEVKIVPKNVDDRGDLDLTKQIENLKKTIEGYKLLIKLQKDELWKLRQISSELEKANNLLQGYKNVITDLSTRLIK